MRSDSTSNVIMQFFVRNVLRMELLSWVFPRVEKDLDILSPKFVLCSIIDVEQENYGMLLAVSILFMESVLRRKCQMTSVFNKDIGEGMTYDEVSSFYVYTTFELEDILNILMLFMLSQPYMEDLLVASGLVKDKESLYLTMESKRKARKKWVQRKSRVQISRSLKSIPRSLTLINIPNIRWYLSLLISRDDFNFSLAYDLAVFFRFSNLVEMPVDENETIVYCNFWIKSLFSLCTWDDYDILSFCIFETER